jgi:hypothetical protein
MSSPHLMFCKTDLKNESRNMGLIRRVVFPITFLVLVVLLVLMNLPLPRPVIFMHIPRPSATYDCDDATLAMYRYLQSISGEGFADCNHVWLLVKADTREIAFDWGTPRFDRQHYEGYPGSLDYLISAVDEDFKNEGQLAAAGQQSSSRSAFKPMGKKPPER